MKCALDLHRTGSRIAPIALIAAIALIAGCPGSLDDPARFTSGAGHGTGPDGGTSDPEGCASADAIPESLFRTTCVRAGCHDARGRAQGLDLESPNARARLVGVHASEGPGILVDPASPSQSVLYRKLTSQPPFGARMPPGAPLDDQTIACALAWISGAHDGDAGDASPSD
jgi:hypothetical protein